MTFAELQTEVQSWLLDLPSGATTRIPGWINKAIKDAEERYNFRCMEETIAATQTTAQTRLLVAKPSDWKEHRGDPYLLNQDGSNSPIKWAASEQDMLDTYASATPAEGNTTPVDEGTPRYLLEREGQIDVYPLPDEGSEWDNGNYRVVVPYWKYLAALSASSDANFFTTEAPYYVIWQAVALGLKWNRDEERAKSYMVDAEREFKRLVRKDKLSRLPDRFAMPVYSGVYGKPSRFGLRS